MRPSPLLPAAVAIAVLLLAAVLFVTREQPPSGPATSPGKSPSPRPGPERSITISGRALVTDGDTIRIESTRVRIHGIDAPESDQGCLRQGKLWPCGLEAENAMRRLIGGREVNCVQVDWDKYDRMVAKCSVGGSDLGAAMVSTGLALAYRAYAQDYVPQEDHARAERLGMWNGEFVPPWDWRHGYPNRETFRIPPPRRNCRIKGNISRSGEKIYHTPQSPWYDATRLDEAGGERWFCSEKEARAAGWRSYRNPPSLQ